MVGVVVRIDVWRLLDVYKDVIINGLDLVSFTLITPTLLGFNVELLAASIKILFASFICITLIIIVIVSTYIIDGLDNILVYNNISISRSFINVFLLLLEVSVGLFITALIEDHIEYRIDEFSKKHFFLSGVIIFIITRIVAFSIGVHSIVSRTP